VYRKDRKNGEQGGNAVILVKKSLKLIGFIQGIFPNKTDGEGRETQQTSRKMN